MDDETKQEHLDHGDDDERRHTRIMSEFGDEGTDHLLNNMAHARLIDEDRIYAVSKSSRHYSDDWDDELSATEIEVLRYLSHGLNRHATAAGLGIPEETLKSQLTMIRDKLRAKNAVQAVAIAVGRGLIPNPESGETPHRRVT